MLVPPVNFALVVGQLYRSGHPIDLNYEFLQHLHLKTIVYIGEGCPASIYDDYQRWVESQNIRLIHLPAPSVKEPFVETSRETATEALKIIMDRDNHPILLHSNKGKHRVGVITALVRKCLQQWYLTPIFEEYIRFAKGKADSDFGFIEEFDLEPVDIDTSNYPKWIMHGERYERFLAGSDYVDRHALSGEF